MRKILAAAAILTLAGCGSIQKAQPSQDEALATAEAPTEAPRLKEAGTAPEPLKVVVPQMAYSYGYVFRLPERAIAKVQGRHVALCDALGPTRCQLLSMESAGGDEDAASAKLKLRVASGVARKFGAELTSVVTGAGGRAVSSTITAEDVSKDIVDTEARLKQRELLVARLTEVLRTRQGKVAELVEAERSVAAAQEEIDQAKGWLAELRGRVAMSTVEIRYQAIAPGPAAARGGLADAVVQSASLFVGGLSAILQLAIILAPWALLIGVIVFAARRLLPRWRPRRSERIEPEASAAD
ncbi:DUF4349 domain-containing protein [Sphingomonas sp. DT-204]|uniref:DUF4349 domain-containing protein n=1 Tax=Sphingomonas sp. DT-204 TaxID=3396166 RepID=UPI003F1BCDD6